LSARIGERGRQERIHALLLELAGAGQRVARLKASNSCSAAGA
jgi:siroheme synthase